MSARAKLIFILPLDCEHVPSLVREAATQHAYERMNPYLGPDTCTGAATLGFPTTVMEIGASICRLHTIGEGVNQPAAAGRLRRIHCGPVWVPELGLRPCADVIAHLSVGVRAQTARAERVFWDADVTPGYRGQIGLTN